MGRGAAASCDSASTCHCPGAHDSATFSSLRLLSSSCTPEPSRTLVHQCSREAWWHRSASQMRKQAPKSEHIRSGQFEEGGAEFGWSRGSLRLPTPEPCVSKGRGWVCRCVGRTVPGCVLCMLHAGLGDKHLFLPAPLHVFTLLTHTRSCQIPEVKPHRHTHPHTGKAATATDLPLRPFSPIHLGWLLPQGAQNMQAALP